jgi:acetoacetyl-CoA synthetase
MTQSSAVKFLLPIWQRVLKRSAISANDDFFDLGGDPSLAERIFAEIAEECGRDLPPVLIYRASTIAPLAALLQESDPPRVPPLLLLKAGPDGPPIFIAHSIGGTVFGFFHLVNKIETWHSIYGMQARGIDRVDKPFTTIEAMAQFHLEAIKKLQPIGPYILIGYSLGGLVALEIAQRLLARGEKLALLALVDSYPHRNHLAADQRVLLSLRLAKRRVWSLIKTFPGRTRSNTLEHNAGSAPRQSHSPISSAQVMQRMRDAASLAWRRYRPRFYPGTIKFVKADISTHFPDDPVALWSHLAAEFEVETVPGDHGKMIAVHFESLAAVLSRYLDEAPLNAP